MADFGTDKFREGLEQLGYEVEDRGDNRVAIKHTITAGRFQGRQITIGFEVPPDFDITPPTGPHISPRLLPLKADGADHHTRAVESPNFGVDWEYLSRPFPTDMWPRKRSTANYLHYILHILESL